MNTNQLPNDINKGWLAPIRRMQSVARNNGLAILRMTVLVDKNGTPVCWTNPSKTLIEPTSKANNLLTLFLDTMGDED